MKKNIGSKFILGMVLASNVVMMVRPAFAAGNSGGSIVLNCPDTRAAAKSSSDLVTGGSLLLAGAATTTYAVVGEHSEFAQLRKNRALIQAMEDLVALQDLIDAKIRSLEGVRTQMGELLDTVDVVDDNGKTVKARTRFERLMEGATQKGVAGPDARQIFTGQSDAIEKAKMKWTGLAVDQATLHSELHDNLKHKAQSHLNKKRIALLEKIARSGEVNFVNEADSRARVEMVKSKIAEVKERFTINSAGSPTRGRVMYGVGGVMILGGLYFIFADKISSALNHKPVTGTPVSPLDAEQAIINASRCVISNLNE